MRVTPFLMFAGNAEQAMTMYVALFPGSSIEFIDRYGDAGPGKSGTIKQAAMILSGQRIMCIDSPVEQDFGFNPATSLYVDTDSEAQLQSCYDGLLEQGQALMPLGNYGFSQAFAWVQDRFGVSWQLNLP